MRTWLKGTVVVTEKNPKSSIRFFLMEGEGLYGVAVAGASVRSRRIVRGLKTREESLDKLQELIADHRDSEYELIVWGDWIQTSEWNIPPRIPADILKRIVL